MPKLIRGFFLESRDPSVRFDKVEIAAILKEVRDAEHVEVDTVGKGRERRFETLHVQGAWKEVDGFIPHVVILPKIALIN